MSPAETSRIRDIGYTPYRGARTPARRRPWVIARNVVEVAWKSRWGVKMPLLAALGTTVAASVVMYVLRLQLASVVRARGVPIPRAEAIVFFADEFYKFSAFVIAAVVGCAAIADDLRLGAFQFYFARPIRPRAYVAGKLGGLALLIGIPMLGGPLVLALVRLLFAESFADAVTLSPIIPRAALLGLVGTAAFVLPAAGLGALVARRQPAQALFAVYYLLISPASAGIAMGLEFPYLRVIGVDADVSIVGRWIFGLPPARHDPPVWLAAAALVVLSAAGLAVVLRRVSRAETAGLGGS